MADIKIDVSEVLRDYFIPLMIALFVGLLSYALIFENWLWSAIVFVGVFLSVELIIKIWKGFSHRMTVIKNREYESNVIKEKRHIEYMRAMSFYNSLNEGDKKLAMEIYQHPITETSTIYERFVKPDSQLGRQILYRSSAFCRSSYEGDYYYISIVNYHEYSFNGALLHVSITPEFQKVLETISLKENSCD